MDQDHGADATGPEPEAAAPSGEHVDASVSEPTPEPDAAPAAYVSDGSPAFGATGPDVTADTAGTTGSAASDDSAPLAPSWAWSTEPTDPALRPAAGVPPDDKHPSDAAPAPKRGGVRSALVGGLAGALVGALVAGGLVVAFDDDPDPQPVRTQVETEDGTARPATVVVEPGDIRSILDAARPAVVSIDVGGRGELQGTGTGFIVAADGIIVTNAHVVDGFDDVTVHLADGDELPGQVVGSDTRLDLAVVQVDRGGLPTLELGDSDALQVGDAVVAIGNALGLSEGSGATVTTGIISGLDRVVDVGSETLFNAIQTDAAINPGNSGGPLVDMNGRVIGINTAIASPETANNVGFAISISSAQPIIDDLRAGRAPQIAFLGVTTEPLTANTADELGVDQGAVVGDVSEGSAAEQAGIQQGDVIVEVAGTTIDSVEDVASEVRKHRPDDDIDVVIVRDGNRQTLTVTLGDRPEDF
jgi:S1-C subfamily serine protease